MDFSWKKFSTDQRFIPKEITSQKIHALKGIKDKKNFVLIFAAAKSNEKLVNQKYATLIILDAH